MNQDYEDIFGFLFNEEREKIPRLFRFFNTRKKIIAGLAILGVLLVTVLILISVYYSTAETGSVNHLSSGGSIPIVTYDNRVLVAQIIVAGLMLILAVWLEGSVLMEKRAYKNASLKANRLYQAERHRREMIWQDWKMMNRDY